MGDIFSCRIRSNFSHDVIVDILTQILFFLLGQLLLIFFGVIGVVRFVVFAAFAVGSNRGVFLEIDRALDSILG